MNNEQGISNDEVKRKISDFIIPCSIFDIRWEFHLANLLSFFSRNHTLHHFSPLSANGIFWHKSFSNLQQTEFSDL